MNITTLQLPKSQTNNWISLKLNNIKYIIIHHPEARMATPEQINEWHLQNGWSGGFGYNEYIRKDGTIVIGRGDNMGAQAQGYNEVSYGICCEGNYDIESEMPQTQYISLLERLVYHSERLNKPLIQGHRFFMSTNCPGKYFPLDKVIQDVSNQLNINKIINNPKLINSPSYWRLRIKPKAWAKGAYVRQLILNFVAMFKLCNSFEEVMKVMVDMGVVKSPDYWLQAAVNGGKVKGDYLKQLIINMGSKL
jgi:hypothetical protein